MCGKFAGSQGINKLKNKYLSLFLISNTLIIIDQYTKLLIKTHVPLYEKINVVDNFFNITHIRNSGVAFGLFADLDLEYKALIFVVVSLVAIFAILVIFYQTPRDKMKVLFGLILIFSGAVGNLFDRILHKEVIDFLDFYYKGYHWPSFNVADSCITIGVCLMVMDLFHKYPPPVPPGDSSQKSENM